MELNRDLETGIWELPWTSLLRSTATVWGGLLCALGDPLLDEGGLFGGELVLLGFGQVFVLAGEDRQEGALRRVAGRDDLSIGGPSLEDRLGGIDGERPLGRGSGMAGATRLGEERLGGAKMGFLDSNIVLKVVDSFGIDYKVQLSKYHSAWIDKQSLQRLPGKQSAPYYLTSSWKVSGDGAFDYVSINLEEKLPYRSQQQINPSKIVVDIFGATSNSNWITQLKTAKEIKNVYYDQTEDDVFRVTIELKHAQHWGHSIYYDTTGRKLVVRVKRQPAVIEIKKLQNNLHISTSSHLHIFTLKKWGLFVFKSKT